MTNRGREDSTDRVSDHRNESPCRRGQHSHGRQLITPIQVAKVLGIIYLHLVYVKATGLSTSIPLLSSVSSVSNTGVALAVGHEQGVRVRKSHSSGTNKCQRDARSRTTENLPKVRG